MKTHSINHLTDTQYLVQFLKLHNISVKTYHDYCRDIIESHQCIVSDILLEHSINVMPYLFTSSAVERNVFDRFLMYCARYVELPKKEGANEIYMLNIFQKDVETIVSIILLMQYYFL